MAFSLHVGIGSHFSAARDIMRLSLEFVFLSLSWILLSNDCSWVLKNLVASSSDVRAEMFVLVLSIPSFNCLILKKVCLISTLRRDFLNLYMMRCSLAMYG